MTYGTRQLKNGKVEGYLKFNTGKTVYLNPKENREYEQKLRDAEYTGFLKGQAAR